VDIAGKELDPDNSAILSLFGVTVVNPLDFQLQYMRGSSAGAWTTLFHGVVDSAVFNPLKKIMSLECRDYLARLIDSRISRSWLNLDARELVEVAITSLGLTPSVQFDGGMVGQFWQIEHKRSSTTTGNRLQSIFDVVRSTANSFGCDLYAEGRGIFCVPAVVAPANVTSIGRIIWDGGCRDSDLDFHAQDIQLSRDFSAVANAVIQVSSWDSRQRTENSIYMSAAGLSDTLPSADGPLHGFRVPGRRQADVEQIAQEKYRLVAAHQWVAEVTGPGNLKLKPRGFLNFSGSDSGWDRTYSIDAVETSFSLQSGLVQRITLRDRSAGLT